MYRHAIRRLGLVNRTGWSSKARVDLPDVDGQCRSFRVKLGRTVTASHDVLCCRNWWNRRSTLDFPNWSGAPGFTEASAPPVHVCRLPPSSALPTTLSDRFDLPNAASHPPRVCTMNNALQTSSAAAAGPSRTVTLTGTPPAASPPDEVGILRLRPQPRSRSPHTANNAPRRVVWSQETVDNEGLGRKKSKSKLLTPPPSPYSFSS